MIKNIVKNLWELVYPSSIYCIMCGSVIDNRATYSLCNSCIKKFLWISNNVCIKCGKLLVDQYDEEVCPDCQEREHFFDKGFTCCTYGLYERNLILEFKKRDKSYLGRVLGKILYDRFVIENICPDVIIEVPIHFRKLRSRGYNQAALMAMFFAEHMGIPFEEGVIKRRRETKAMKRLGVWERLANMEDAFTIEEKNIHKVKGKTVVLVDDIYTTGATLDMCSRVLKEAGADKVYVLTFAAGSMMVTKT